MPPFPLESRPGTGQTTLISVCVLLYRAASRCIIPILPLLVRELGAKGAADIAIWTGWILAAPFLVSLVSTPLWGSIGDRFGRKKITVAAALGFALCFLLMAQASSLWQLLVFASLQEILGGFYPAAVSFTASGVSPDRRAASLGYLQGAAATGNVLGPLAGALLAALVGTRDVLFLIALVMVACGALIMIGTREKRTVTVEVPWSSLVSNLCRITHRRILLFTSIGLFVYAASIAGLRPVFTLFTESLLDAGQDAAVISGTLLSVFGAASILTSILLGTLLRRWSPARVMTVGSLIAGFGFVLAGSANSVLMVGIALFIAGLAVGVIQPLYLTRMSLASGPDHMAGIMGVGSSFQLTGNLIGPLAMGYLGAGVGPWAPFLAAGIGMSVIAWMETQHRETL